MEGISLLSAPKRRANLLVRYAGIDQSEMTDKDVSLPRNSVNYPA